MTILAQIINTKEFRNRKGEVLFIDARKFGTMIDRKRRELSDDDMAKISDTYHAWRGEEHAIERRGEYSNIAGFSFSAKLENIKEHGYVLTPGRFVGAEDDADDGVPFAEKITRLTAKLKDQFAEGDRLEQDIKKNLKGFGYDL